MSATKTAPAQAAPARATQKGIDPRGPRFGAGITGILLLVVVGLGLSTAITPLTTIAARAAQPAFIIFAIITVIFGWGAFAGIKRHPYGWIFRTFIRPRLKPPTELEDPVPPTFSQGVGFVITLIGVALHLLGVPFGLVIPAAAAFIAAFLNSVFAYCLGCQIYLALVRAGILGRKGAVAT
jgi:Domain of unknown function (DUF4395)